MEESNLEEMRKIFHDILKDDEDDQTVKVGITGDPDCPYRDWRGTPLEIGATVVFPGTNYSSGSIMKQGLVIDIIEKPMKKATPENWKFMVRVELQDVTGGGHAIWKKREIDQAQGAGKPKRQGVSTPEKMTVVF